ncbi:Glutamine--fructose-6-phosphate aminotransferase (isomerizing) [uncultured delta proteobacterium]|uniref:Glutamine--fructose-6-phosphate aminotransferase [isomerizing] n=1 Tax=uncultured delta proteobacterium TaxID=34034 RepID=A0A212KES2_9DELT|nr:Glutamine--fructose-6-phosphate aminotransferase (isomerizing) [uncultured delta proteobacterium]
MCGIMGITGRGNAVPGVIAGLRALEYRGYDSVGMVWQKDGKLSIKRVVGRVDALEAAMPEGACGTTAIGHTRWATHGGVTEYNAHPHMDPAGTIAVVHNGIIDNYAELRAELEEQGAAFTSETDTEVVAHLIAREYQGDLVAAVEAVLPRIVGVYAFGIMAKDQPGLLVGARKGSPLTVGFGDGVQMLASDVVPFLTHTRQALYLDDGQIAVLTPDGYEIRQNGSVVTPVITTIEWSAEDASKEGYEHYMLKEIYEQPKALKTLIDARLSLPADGMPLITSPEGDIPDEALDKATRIVLLAHGTAYHAAMVGRLLIERVARIPCYPEYASDFRYRYPIIEPGTLYVVVTQSGETIDTLSALRLVKEFGHPTLAVVNVPSSTIAREATYVSPLMAGPEIGVASTKAFTSMIASLYLLALRFGMRRGALTVEEARRRAGDLLRVSARMHEVLLKADGIKDVALKYADKEHFMFLGRGTGWPLALEGALKLKEISYIHAEGMNSSEIKHGPLALVDKEMPVLFIALKGERYDRLVANINEVKAREGRIIAIISEDDKEIGQYADDVFRIHDDCGVMNAILCSAPLQLLAYHAAVARGADVDKPKNLAKSVTVE